MSWPDLFLLGIRASSSKEAWERPSLVRLVSIQKLGTPSMAFGSFLHNFVVYVYDTSVSTCGILVQVPSISMGG